MEKYVLALDQGTTSSRAIVFDHDGKVVSIAQKEFPQILPTPGVVEHDPDDIWSSQLWAANQALQQRDIPAMDVAAIGIANQRETTILWDRESGKPIANAIVWQSRVSAPICESLKEQGLEAIFHEKTGLLLDPYFSGTKIKYLLDQDDDLRELARQGKILFGTVDTYLIWRMTNGKSHMTDVSNASRTLLFNIHTLQWDDELLDILGIPSPMLPSVQASSGMLGTAAAEHFGRPLPITGCAGDQQAALFGQACFESGTAKNTYGTGCFLLLNTGHQPVSSSSVLTTVGWSIDGKVTYCLEGSVFIGGAVVQWLRDGLGIIRESGDVEKLARSVDDSDGVYFVPALVGLGTPHWDPYARGTIIGLTRGSTAGHLARAAVESMAFQSRDVLAAMQEDANVDLKVLKVDGGASLNNDLMQFQSDILNVSVQRPQVAETTALGAAYLAGLAVGFWSDTADVRRNWQLDREFHPKMADEMRQQRHRFWQKAVQRSLDWAKE